MANPRQTVYQPGDNDELISFGGEIKALGDGRVGGYLVRFTTKDDPDLSGDFFTKDTDFGPAASSAAWFHHRQSAKLADGTIMPALKKRFPDVILKKDNFGVWAESVLNLRDQYEKFVYDQVVAGKMGFSSGTAPHTVDREVVGKGVAWVKSWMLGTDASYTPSPCEYRNTVVSIKSLVIPVESALPAADNSNSQPITTNSKEDKMEKDEIKTAIDAALAERDAVVAQKKQADDALKTAEAEGYKKAVEELKSKNMLKTTPAFIKNLGNDSDGGVMAFKSWLATGEHNSELLQPSNDPAWATKAAFNITTGASGSYLVPDPLYQAIIAKRTLMSWARQAPVQTFSTPADHILVPVEDTSATAFVLTAEAAAYNENEPTVAQKDLILYKYTKLVKMSEEFVNYQGTNFDAWIANVFARAEAVTENTIFTKGSGSGQPEGVYTSATNGNTVTTSAVLVPADLTNLIGQLGAGYNTQGQTGFLMQNATNWYLRGTSSANYFAFMNTPQPGVSTAYNEGFIGRPAYISDDMDAYTVASSAGHSVIYGNWNYFGIAEKPGLLIQRNPYLYMANGQIGLFATMYRGSAVLQAEAFYRTVGK